MESGESGEKNVRYKFQLPSRRPVATGHNAVFFSGSRPGTSRRDDLKELPRIDEREYGRIVVMLGLNGSGKSRLLKSLKESPFINGESRTPVYVEGGRAIDLPENKQRKKKPSQFHQVDELTKRVSQLLAHLEHDRHEVDTPYYSELARWVEADCTGDGPIKTKESNLHRLNGIFQQLLPRISINTSDEKWVYKNGDAECGFKKFSDGEKQVLCLLGDVGIMSPDNALVIVDEPELNLHPGLAANLWNWIEEQRPNSVFVYATHSISFAMRPNVTDIIVLRSPDQEPIHLNKLSSFEGADWEPFLGAIPAIISSSGRILAVEGKKRGESFDKFFYPWVIGGDIEVFSAGECHSVRAAIKHEGIWEKMGTVTARGIVDRDYRTENWLDGFRSDGCMVLKYHEAESYLCHPSLLFNAGQLIGSTRSEGEILEQIAKICEGMVAEVALQRTIARSEVRLSPGRPTDETTWPKGRVNGGVSLDKWIVIAAERARDFETKAKAAYQEECDLCERAIADRNIDDLLAFFPGKKLLGILATWLQFPDEPSFLRAVKTNLRFDKYNHLIELRKTIRDAFS